MQPGLSTSSSALGQQQAQAFIPTVWYEGDRLTTALYYFLAIPLFILFWWQYRLSPPLIWSVVGLGLYGLGWLADTISTWQCLRLLPAFEARGVRYPLKERSWFMGEDPRLLKQLVNGGSLYSLAIFLASWVAPALGIAGGLAHLGAAISNRRKWQRLKLQLAFIDQQQKGEAQTSG